MLQTTQPETWQNDLFNIFFVDIFSFDIMVANNFFDNFIYDNILSKFLKGF